MRKETSVRHALAIVDCYRTVVGWVVAWALGGDMLLCGGISSRRAIYPTPGQLITISNRRKEKFSSVVFAAAP